MELYIQTVKKRQNHERRLTIDPTAAADDEGDGWVPETSYKAEQLKNDVRISNCLFFALSFCVFCL